MKLDVKNKYIAVGDKENLGKYFLLKSAEFTIIAKYESAFEFIKQGLDIIVNDYISQDEIQKVFSSDSRIAFINNDLNNKEIYFIKAFLLSFENDDNLLKLGLNLINIYIDLEEDAHAYFIKGKLQTKLKNYEIASQAYSKSLKIKQLPCVIFNLGCLKEHKLNFCGLAEFYISIINNPLSNSCALQLKKCVDRKLNLKAIKNTENIYLLDSLINDSMGKFYLKYMDAVSHRKKVPIHEFKDINQSTLNSFICFLEDNYKVFDLNNCISKSDYKYYEKLDIFKLTSGRTKNDLSLRFTKQNENLNDNFIDDALDGFADAFWNID